MEARFTPNLTHTKTYKTKALQNFESGVINDGY